MKTPENSFKKALCACEKQSGRWLGLSRPFSAKVVSDITRKVY
jgi:2-keto-3-deoxy-L-rhamnonate aldolase RhmA